MGRMLKKYHQIRDGVDEILRRVHSLSEFCPASEGYSRLVYAQRLVDSDAVNGHTARHVMHLSEDQIERELSRKDKRFGKHYSGMRRSRALF